ncbi:MAG: DNA-directed RNA polymerase subunit omega [Lachnospira sp.]|nr:DNA-directed RNA polymerase subunit omega [Lachnospira sp.]
MMIHPSYTELMAVINSEVEEGEQPLVQSRYSIVKATATRAKEIIDARSIQEKINKAKADATVKEKEKDKDKKEVEEKKISAEDERKLIIGTPLIHSTDNDKPLSIAVSELYQGKVKIVGNSDEQF